MFGVRPHATRDFPEKCLDGMVVRLCVWRWFPLWRRFPRYVAVVDVADADVFRWVGARPRRLAGIRIGR